MPEQNEIRIPVSHVGQVSTISGKNDEYFIFLENALNVKIILRGDEIIFSGHPEKIERAAQIMQYLLSLAASGVEISQNTINYALQMEIGDYKKAVNSLSETVYITPKGKKIKARTIGQRLYLAAIEENDLTFAIGPAGTGKTYLAVAMAVSALKKKEVNRIILSRPAVEAGEKLGFLPGDLQDKVNPYLRPIYDGLNDVLGQDVAQKYMERGIIEVVPLAYMRGRTLEDAFIILDEAQNTTSQQMKMFLTRLGVGSKSVITGDITQIDLPRGETCGLIEAERRLRDIDGFAFCYLSKADVVRHPLVQKIIEAYEKKWI